MTEASTVSAGGTGDWRPRATADMLRARAELLSRLRSFFARRGVVEVDTPLRAESGIPETHIAPLSCDGGVLLPSPEVWMKRLLATGSGDIYQLAHAFRAGERGRHHAEEFMLCEWYRCGFDDGALMDELDALLRHCGAPENVHPVPRLRYETAFERHAGIHPLAPPAALAQRARALDIAPDLPSDTDAPVWRDLLMGVCVQPRLGLDGPLLLTAYPATDSPLAEPVAGDTRWAQRFELFWNGVELANGCVERGTADTLPEGTNPGLVAAMASGLPPCAGVALGVDRLLMVLRGLTELSAVRAFD